MSQGRATPGGAGGDSKGERASSGARRSRPALLVVESYRAARQALAEILRDCDYEVIVAADAAEALERGSAAERLDALVADAPWPDRGAVALVAALRRRHPGMRTVLLCTVPSPELAGTCAVLPKPIDVDALLSLLGGE